MNSICRVSIVAILLSSVSLMAQYQVNTRVDNSLYGAANMGSVKYSNNTSVPMPSEVRFAYYQSGATPSEVKMNMAAQGRITPNGAMDYIPNRASPGQSAYVPPSQGNLAYNTGSVQRPVMPASPNQAMISPVRINAAMPTGQIR